MTEFGFMMGLSPREPIGRFAELAAQAESLGFEVAWLADSQLYTKDVFVGLTLAAARTSRIGLGPGVTNPVTRHPTVVANAMAALQEVSGERAILGLGSGDASVLPLRLRPASLAALRAAITTIRSIAEEGRLEAAGQEIRIPTARRFPILVSASQPGMLRLAGELADGVILMGAAEPELTQWQLDRVAEGAAAARRSLADVSVDLWFSISMLGDIEQAVRDVRPWATSQARWFDRWKELPEPLARFRADFDRAAREHSFQSHLAREGGEGGVSDEFVRWVGVAGNVDDCVTKIRPLLALKVDRITFALLPGGRGRRLEAYASELIPRLRALTG